MVNLLSLLKHLGPGKLALNGLYRFGLLSGHYRRASPIAPGEPFDTPPLPQPAPDSGGRFPQADEIAAGLYRPFNGQPLPLDLTPPGLPAHWSEHARGRIQPPENSDIKFTWEPARFDWVYTLARAYLSSGEQGYAQAFWHHTGSFMDANPANLGPNWESGQEVALRLIALLFALRAFARSSHSSPARVEALQRYAAQHAARIPLTLPYARSQNNNHLVSEAAGLYSAGLLLPADPAAVRWRALGWKWLNHALQAQIAADGAYIQHSANYQRLALQLALWVDAIAPPGQPLPAETRRKLADATLWLLALTDPAIGSVPNLGANDGASIMPLNGLPYADYRPVLQAASAAFLGAAAFPPGAWDEQRELLGLVTGRPTRASTMLTFSPPALAGVLRPNSRTWAYLRAAYFSDRPSHADQLHLDLWWRGTNLLQDAGTFQYNAPPPWDNALAGTAVHNTISVDGQDQMTRAGRFLWLDWAQAEITAAGDDFIAARHNGYARIGVIHARQVRFDGGWQVSDTLTASTRAWENTLHTARIHWLLPDLPWRLEDHTLILQTARGEVTLRLDGDGSLSLARAGELLAGQGSVPVTRGWVSPTYGVKVPALSLALEVTARLPVRLETRLGLP